MLGFSIKESMSGSFEPLSGEQWLEGFDRMSFIVRWGTTNIVQSINPFSDRFMIFDLEGTLFFSKRGTDGVVSSSCHGTLHLNYLQKYLEYKLTFQLPSDYYNTYLLVARKENVNLLKPWELKTTHTTCYGELTDYFTEEVVGKSVLHFDLSMKNLISFITSLRVEKNRG